MNFALLADSTDTSLLKISSYRTFKHVPSIIIHVPNRNTKHFIDGGPHDYFFGILELESIILQNSDNVRILPINLTRLRHQTADKGYKFAVF